MPHRTSHTAIGSSNQWLRVAKDRADLNALEADRHRQIAERRELEADRHLTAFQLRQAKEALDKGQVERSQGIGRRVSRSSSPSIPISSP